ncbi:PsbP-related protein [Saccharospirillum salsuginis]|uniref:PsbP C-terminal domain-containing protein n=1 Tax=Saccharospirillum salsuginis TaxID=418750 RepID=A0A918K284_9GAMM|nr:PsbP-related protein [Saccharospirillum salsuginis]GGX40802.1 hypothetical protein GCM10007392_04490 [Saccharospirillum salsuginis]
MNKAVHCGSILLALLLTACSNLSTGPETRANTAATPDGYRWYTADNGVGTFLVPDGWHVKEETRNGTDALFISRENIDQQGRYQVGMTVNRVPNFSQTTSVPATEYAESFIKQLMVKHDVLMSNTNSESVEPRYIARVRLTKDPATIVHYITVGRAATDELFLIYFEAPESEWEDALETAQPMLEAFRLGQ